MESSWLTRLALALRVLFGRASYVVIYDHDGEGEELEEYYGYFGSPDEAREMYNTAFGSDPEIIEGRTKLCLVVEDWN